MNNNLLKYNTLILILLILSNCQTPQDSNIENNPKTETTLSDSTEIDTIVEVVEEPEPIGELELSIMNAGLVDIQSIQPSIVVDLKYATADNFMDSAVYGKLKKCYLQPKVAQMLAEAQQYLYEEDSTLSLLVFDGVRPKSVQFIMWNIVKGTSKQKYVASPYGGGSMHNYGAAVDLSLINVFTNQEIDMGTEFDFFGTEAQPRYQYDYLWQGKLTQEHIDNRMLLKKVMKQAGFKPIMSEWWHFNAFNKDYTRKQYNVVE